MSNVVERFIGELKKKQAEEAAGALSHPGDSLFYYGKACGRYQGYEEALAILASILRDADDEERAL